MHCGGVLVFPRTREGSFLGKMQQKIILPNSIFCGASTRTEHPDDDLSLSAFSQLAFRFSALSFLTCSSQSLALEPPRRTGPNLAKNDSSHITHSIYHHTVLSHTLVSSANYCFRFLSFFFHDGVFVLLYLEHDHEIFIIICCDQGSLFLYASW